MPSELTRSDRRSCFNLIASKNYENLPFLKIQFSLFIGVFFFFKVEKVFFLNVYIDRPEVTTLTKLYVIKDPGILYTL